jgi:uncharacterized SAM-binding protein YcdF (DUF218 family)
LFFYLSKILWFLSAPSSLAVVLTLVGTALLFTRHARLGRTVAAAGAIALVVVAFSPFGKLVMRTLEDRFPIADDTRPIAGIVVLGGAAGITRGQVSFNDAASRMTAAIGLALKHPDARIVFSGGDAGFFDRGPQTEAEAGAALFRLVGIAVGRIALEDRSRNTRENALFTREMIGAQPDGRWVVVTSAFHMPRAIACLRAVGLDLEAYPVDFRTEGRAAPDLRPFGRLSEGMRLTDLAVKEWIGLVTYRLAGYTDELFPSPSRFPSPSARR